MPDSALVVGGTRFIGRHTVEELLDHDYRVTTFTRGESGNPFADREPVASVHGDRTDRDALDTEVGIVQTGPSDLAAAGVGAIDFPLYAPDPALAAMEKLAALGWESTEPAGAVARTARAHRERGRDGCRERARQGER